MLDWIKGRAPPAREKGKKDNNQLKALDDQRSDQRDPLNYRGTWNGLPEWGSRNARRLTRQK